MSAKKLPDTSDISDYLERVSNRIIDIDDQTKILVQAADLRMTKMSRDIHSIKKEMEFLKRSLQTAKQIIERQKVILKTFSREFKGIAKKDQFDRVKAKIDEWAPETFVTRKEVKTIFSQH